MSWSDELRRAGRPAFAYHAGLEPDEREKAHRHFRDDFRGLSSSLPMPSEWAWTGPTYAV